MWDKSNGVMKITYGHHPWNQEGFLSDNQIYFCKFFSYREVWYINLYVLCETNTIIWSKLLMDLILGVKKILHGSGTIPEWWPELVCQFLCYREVWYINLYVSLDTNPMVWSKLNMGIILGIRKILLGSGRVPERWPDLLLSVF